MNIRTIILAHRQGRELMPLTDGSCVAMLPVAGKPVIEYAIESLHKAGIKEAAISIDAAFGKLMALVGDGSRWGMKLSYSVASTDVTSAISLPDHGGPDPAETLTMHGDMLLNLAIDEFLRQARATGQKRVYGLKGDTTVIMWESGAPELAARVDLNAADIAESSCIELGATRINTLGSIIEYHQANMDLISGKLALLTPHGKARRNGLTLGYGSKISGKSLKSGFAHIGNNSNVHETVQFDNGVVVGDRVIIDRSARLENSIVLSDTYIGEMVTARNAIIQGNTLIRTDSGRVMHLDDELLLAINPAP